MSVRVDQDGFGYVLGEYRDTVDLDPGPWVDIRTSKGVRDAFLVQVDGTTLAQRVFKQRDPVAERRLLAAYPRVSPLQLGGERCHVVGQEANQPQLLAFLALSFRRCENG